MTLTLLLTNTMMLQMNLHGTTTVVQQNRYWRGIYESCYDTERSIHILGKCLALLESPTWWDEQYGTDYGYPKQKQCGKIWKKVIIRQGDRENVTNSRFRKK